MWLLVVATAFAAEPPSNAVIADLGLHVIGVGFQRTVSPGVALQVAADLYVPWTAPVAGDLAGFVLRARPFFHPAGRAPVGFWVSPFAQAGVARAAAPPTGAVGAAGASAGYAGLIARRVLLSGGLGAQVHAGAVPEPCFVRPHPTVDAIVGYTF